MHITALDFPVFIALSSHEKLIEYAVLHAYAKQRAPIGDVKATAVLSHSPGCRSLENGNGVQEDRTMA